MRPNPSGSIELKTSRATAAAVTSESQVGPQVEVGPELELEVGSEVGFGSEPEPDLEVGLVFIVDFGSEVEVGAEGVLALSGPSTAAPAPLPTLQLSPPALSAVLLSQVGEKGRGRGGIRPSA